MTGVSDPQPVPGAARGVYRWRLTYGRNHRTSFVGTKTQAKAERAEWVAAIIAGKIRTAPGTVGQALADYATHTPMAPKTAVETERMIRLHLAPIAAVKLSELTPSAIEALYRRLLDGTVNMSQGGDVRATPLSPATVRRTHGVLHAALERAVKLDMINSNPASRVRPPSGARGITPQVDTDDVLRLIAAARQHSPMLGCYVLLSAATGMRRGEVTALQWADVDLDAGTLHVRRSITKAKGELHVKAPKSGKARTVPLSPMAVDALREWRRTSARVAGWVFPAPDGVSPWGPFAASSAWRDLCEREGVSMRLHDLRHHMATLSLRAGLSAVEVANMLGHSSPHVTMSVYAHVLSPRAPMALDDAITAAKAKG